MTKEINEIIDEIKFRLDHTLDHIKLSLKFCEEGNKYESNYILHIVLLEFSNISELRRKLYNYVQH